MFIASKNRPGKRNGIKREKPKKKKKIEKSENINVRQFSVYKNGE